MCLSQASTWILATTRAELLRPPPSHRTPRLLPQLPRPGARLPSTPHCHPTVRVYRVPFRTRDCQLHPLQHPALVLLHRRAASPSRHSRPIPRHRSGLLLRLTTLLLRLLLLPLQHRILQSQVLSPTSGLLPRSRLVAVLLLLQHRILSSQLLPTSGLLPLLAVLLPHPLVLLPLLSPQ
jgi:hypothetical protein